MLKEERIRTLDIKGNWYCLNNKTDEAYYIMKLTKNEYLKYKENVHVISYNKNCDRHICLAYMYNFIKTNNIELTDENIKRGWKTRRKQFHDTENIWRKYFKDFYQWKIAVLRFIKIIDNQ